MLPAVFVLGFSIIIFVFIFFFIRESASDTYRCPSCSQLAVGEFHRRKCLPLNARDNKGTGQRKAEKGPAIDTRLPALRVHAAHPETRPT